MDADEANASLKDGIFFGFIAKVLGFLRYKSGNFRIKFVAREQRWTAVDVDGHGNFAVQIHLAAIDRGHGYSFIAVYARPPRLIVSFTAFNIVLLLFTSSLSPCIHLTAQKVTAPHRVCGIIEKNKYYARLRVVVAPRLEHIYNICSNGKPATPPLSTPPMGSDPQRVISCGVIL